MARFKRPGYTQIPNEIFDVMMPTMSGAQLKVLCWVARQTLGWQRDSFPMTLNDIATACGLSKTGALEAIQSLEGNGAIEHKNNYVGSGKRLGPSEYRLSIDDEAENEPEKLMVNSVDHCENADPMVNSVDHKTDLMVNSVDHWSDLMVNSVDHCGVAIRSKEKELKEREQKENSSNFFSSLENNPRSENTGSLETEKENRPADHFETQSTLHDLQLSEDVVLFVVNAYRQSRGAKLSKSEAKKYAYKLKSEEDLYSPAEFRSALWNYLATSDDWLREHKWPLGAFLKSVLRYLPDTPPSAQTHPAIQSRTPAAGDVSSSTSAAQSGRGEIHENNRPVHLQYVDTWDSIVSDRPVGQLLQITEKKLKEAICDKDFQSRFGDICHSCQELVDSGEPTKFSWLFTGNPPAWQGLLEGKYDFLKKKSKLSAIDEAIAKARREERGSE